jgi:hypothetical protein
VRQDRIRRRDGDFEGQGGRAGRGGPLPGPIGPAGRGRGATMPAWMSQQQEFGEEFGSGGARPAAVAAAAGGGGNVEEDALRERMVAAQVQPKISHIALPNRRVTGHGAGHRRRSRRRRRSRPWSRGPSASASSTRHPSRLPPAVASRPATTSRRAAAPAAPPAGFFPPAQLNAKRSIGQPCQLMYRAAGSRTGTAAG